MRRLNPIQSLLRLTARVFLAGKYYLSLNYSWHLAWVKAERT